MASAAFCSKSDTGEPRRRIAFAFRVNQQKVAVDASGPGRFSRRSGVPLRYGSLDSRAGGVAMGMSKRIGVLAGVALLSTASLTSVSAVGVEASSMPPQLHGLQSTVSTSSAREMPAATQPGGSVVMWGDAYKDYSHYSGWIPDAAKRNIVSVAAAQGYSLALTSMGRVVAWDRKSELTVPARVRTGIIQIAAGAYHSLALASSGEVVAWSFSNSYDSVPVDAKSGVVAISAGMWYSLALNKSGRVIAWGRDSSRLVLPTETQSGIVAISAGEVSSMALTSTGRVILWDNQTGQLQPTPADAGSQVVAISAGARHYLALTTSGSVVAWGTNACGQTEPAPSPNLGATAIAAGRCVSLAIDRAGRIFQQGTNLVAPPEAATEVLAIAASEYYGIAIVKASLPSIPRNVSATVEGRGISVAWTAPADDGGSAITAYRVVAQPGGQSCTATITSCLVTGIPLGTEVTFTVYAENGAGMSGPSDPSPPTTMRSLKPGPPTSVLAEPSYRSLTVTWQPPADDNGSPVTGYVVSVFVTRIYALTCETTRLKCVVDGLEDGRTYLVEVRALNEFDTSEPSEGVQVTTLCCSRAPSPPLDVSVESRLDGATISWKPSEDGGFPAMEEYVVTATNSEGRTEECRTRSTSCNLSFYYSPFFSGPGEPQGIRDAYTVEVIARNSIVSSEPSKRVKVPRASARWRVSVSGPSLMYVSPRGNGPVYRMTWTIRDPYHLLDDWSAEFYLDSSAYTTAGGMGQEDEEKLVPGRRGVVRTDTGWQLNWTFQYRQVSRLHCDAIYLHGDSDSVRLGVGAEGLGAVGRSMSWRVDCRR